MTSQFRLSVSDDAIGQLNRALLSGNVPLAVELCVASKRWADALALATVRGGDQLARRTLRRYLSESAAAGADEANLIRALTVSGDGDDGWRDFARRCAGSDWRQALAAAATYANAEEFPAICSELGDRRASAGDGHVRFIGRMPQSLHCCMTKVILCRPLWCATFVLETWRGWSRHGSRRRMLIRDQL